jgi:hypothetical protein
MSGREHLINGGKIVLKGTWAKPRGFAECAFCRSRLLDVFNNFVRK